MDPALLKEYGALDISVVSDLPLFVDPFLLFNSENETYQELHEEILRYLRFLRDEAGGSGLDSALINDLYCFEEVKQNWFGFTLFGNGQDKPLFRPRQRHLFGVAPPSPPHLPSAGQSRR